MNYAILDIETTGGSPKAEKITEIAIYIHNGKEVINEFTSLVNPEKNIPYFIINLTGITNAMVADAPKFFEIAKQIIEITEDCIVVGHNVRFDYSFIQAEYKQLGYDYFRETLCTLKLSRKHIPGFPSYSLGNICERLKISINGRHRASGDAYATVSLFEHLSSLINHDEGGLLKEIRPPGKIKNLNGFLTPENINDLPPFTGVYYFHDQEGNLLYLGKSKNIHSRVLSHLGNKSTRRSMEMSEKISGISYELTGSELIALLKESEEIKSFRPHYNRAQRRKSNVYGLYSFKDKNDYINLRIKKIGIENTIPHTCFSSQKEGSEMLSNLIEQHWLCQKLSGMYDTDGACFHYSIRQCNGACLGLESPMIYNERVRKVIGLFEFNEENMLIIDKGRRDDERSVVCIEKGLYRGFGFISIADTYLHIENIKECINFAEDNRDIRAIIKGWLKRNKPEKILKF